ncbi:MAG: 16S rRNA (cytosine(967)-C(5))-methyltransferase RsmB [Eubacterium sp.]|nr:16S rRNA (cytosine(967)-C(5))-methyltransferase RsmB [Eubacterium sp.]
MDINRKTAYDVLMAIEVKKQYSNIALNNYIGRNKPESPAFVREVVYGVLENKKFLDYIISKLITGKLKNVRTPDLTILRMGIYQIAKMDSVPDYAAVDESVQMAKKFARGRDKFINGVLRSYLREKENISLPDRKKDVVKYLSVKYSYEEWIIRLFLEFYSEKTVEEILEAGNITPPLTVRTNLYKITRDQLIEKLEEKGFEVERCSLSSVGLKVKGERILETSLFEEGMFSIQDEASQMVCEYLKPGEGDVVVDVCAAPGGKTLSVAERMKNTGKVYSHDFYENKIGIIQREAERLGLSNVETHVWDATNVKEDLIDKADKVIVDAPCSGLGVVRRKPEIKYKKNSDEVYQLPEKQLAILEASSKYVKKEGVLLYSTCTINGYENEGVAEKFIANNPQFEILSSKVFLPNVDHTDGFFICVMKRKA